MWSVAGMPIVPRNHAVVVNGFLWTILALIFITIRLFTRAVIVKRLGWDDWLMTAAMFFSITFFITVMFQIKYGLGQPVNLATLLPFLASLFSTVPCYNMTQTLYKLSITTQSYRLFTTDKATKIMKYLIAWIIVCGIMTVSGSMFYCFPVRKAWNDAVPGHCVDRSKLNYAVSGFNIVNDLTLLAIPVPFLLKLQVPKKQRVVLMSVFACGVLVTIVSIIRLKALYVNLSGPIEIQPITGVDIALWSGLEINVAIICGSVPALKAFVTRGILKRRGGDSSDYATKSATRKQSQVLPSRIDEQDKPRMKITVQQSIEMKTYQHADDEGSESDLIINDTFSPAIRHQATINATRPIQRPNQISPV